MITMLTYSFGISTAGVSFLVLSCFIKSRFHDKRSVCQNPRPNVTTGMDQKDKERIEILERLMILDSDIAIALPLVFQLFILTNKAYSPGEVGLPFDFVSLICLNLNRDIVGFSPLTQETLNVLR